MSDGEVYFEFVQVGQLMRVAAIDATTGIEVIVITPPNASRHDMQRLALAKLQRKLRSEQSPPPQPRGKYA